MVRSEANVSLKNPVTPPGIDPGTFRLVAQHLNHYATPGPVFISTDTNIITRNVRTTLCILFATANDTNTAALQNAGILTPLNIIH